jgi:para-nitrobenzyl esterase
MALSVKTSLLGLSLVAASGFVSCGGGIAAPPPPVGCTNASTMVVCTQSGQVRGVLEGSVRAFRGIPYAAPPLGNLRWRPPGAPPKWNGVRDASSFGNRCPQTDFAGGVQGNEDCLTLNIFTSNPPANSPQPVMVFFHGGANSLGSTQEAPYIPSTPLVSHGVILVTVEYRLGLLGFLALPELTGEGQGSSGNYGLMDMIQSLAWVHENISNFGGDPKRVMIFGQSSASAAVQVLLSAPPAQGLFSSAAMESRVISSGFFAGGANAAYQNYAPLVPQVGCGGAADVLACLRAVTADEIIQAQLAPGLIPFIDFTSEPIVMPKDPFDRIQLQGSPVPLLIGSNNHEAVGIIDDPSMPLDANGYTAAVHALFDPIQAGSGNAVLALYPVAAYDTPMYALIDVHTDYLMTCNTRNLARAAAGANRPPVWRYFFAHRFENDAFLNSLRSFHTAELPFVFGNLGTIFYTQTSYTPTTAELQFSDDMEGYWARFAATGDPNGAGTAPWLSYDLVNENILKLDDPPLTIQTYHNAQCDFFSSLPPSF